MASARRTWAYPVTALASIGLAISLWLPWYSFRLPGALIDQAVQASQQLGVLGPVIRQGAELARNLGPIHLTAWQVFQQIDIVLAVAAAAAGGLSALAHSGRATGVDRLIAAAGLTALLTSGYGLLVPPGPSGMLHPASGAYIALVCAAGMLFAALAAAGERAAPDTPWQAAAPTPWEATSQLAPQQPWETASSVAPPAAGP